jgi:hypothetical protein
MDFHTLRDTFVATRDLSPEARKISFDEFYLTMLGVAIEQRQGHVINQLQAELDWYRSKRPYYRVWPSIIPALLKVDLDRVMTTSLNIPSGLRTLAIYLPKGHELQFGDLKATSILLAKIWIAKESKELPFEERLKYYRDHPEQVTNGIMILVDSGNKFADFDYLKFRQREGVSINEEVNEIETDFPANILKLACTVMLLENDPELISEDVLADDRYRFDNSNDPDLKQRLIDKARRRGKIGWDIGKVMHTGNVNPHYRHPHFAIRWTGKGRTVPKLSWIKGSFVKREKMLELPSGYEG